MKKAIVFGIVLVMLISLVTAADDSTTDNCGWWCQLLSYGKNLVGKTTDESISVGSPLSSSTSSQTATTVQPVNTPLPLSSIPDSGTGMLLTRYCVERTSSEVVAVENNGWNCEGSFCTSAASTVCFKAKSGCTLALPFYQNLLDIEREENAGCTSGQVATTVAPSASMASPPSLAALSCPQCKDIDEVCMVSHNVGIGSKAVRLVPLACIKG